jgi:putative transposase
MRLVYANKGTTEKLQWVLDRCRELYNAGLQERRDAYEIHVRQHPGYYDEETRKRLTRELTVSYYEQKRELVDIKELRPEYQDIASHVLQDVILRLKLHLHRAMEGAIKTLTLTCEGEHWYAIFTCEIGQPEPLPVSYEDVGIDLGVTHFAALSTGEIIDHPRYLRRAEKKLAKAQQALSRKKHGSHLRKKAASTVTICHRRIANQRKDFQHKAARKLVNRYQVIVFENLQVKNLTKAPAPRQDEETGAYLPNGAAAKAGLNKSILDAGWSTFTAMVSVKAACLARRMAMELH